MYENERDLVRVEISLPSSLTHEPPVESSRTRSDRWRHHHETRTFLVSLADEIGMNRRVDRACLTSRASRFNHVRLTRPLAD